MTVQLVRQDALRPTIASEALAPAGRGRLLDLLACPDCKQPLDAALGCRACCESFPVEDHRPVLFPRCADRDVAFRYSAKRSVRNPDFESCFSYPARCGVAGDGPYHLDEAHADVLARLAPGSTVLEIGCGGAQMREYVEALGHRYVGVDISVSRVTADLQRFGGPDVLCDAHFLPFADRSVDLVYSVAVMEHLACPTLAAQEIMRCLRPGGHYLGNVSFLEPWHDDSFFHMSVLGAHALLAQAGFEVCHIWPSRGYSGFHALMAMGNRATQTTKPIGAALYALYRLGNWLRDTVKSEPAPERRTIEDRAHVAGATDWIARRPSIGEVGRLPT